MRTTSLKEKRVVILGGSTGIGLAVAIEAGTLGAHVVIVSSNENKINDAVAKIPGQATGFKIDLSQESAIEDFFLKLGAFDHMVYTAGENLNLSVLSHTELAQAQSFFKVRYWGAMAAVKYGSPYIKTGGSIVLTSGIASQRPGSGWGVAASICGAMEGFTRAMAMELAPVRVNIVSPGIVKTNLWNGLSTAERDALYTSTAERLPVQKVAEAEDISQTYIYLMEQSYSTGQVVTVDGGGVLC